MLRSDVILSSFGAIRMEQYSHQTLRSPVSTTAALFIFVFFINSFLFGPAHRAAFEHGKRVEGLLEKGSESAVRRCPSLQLRIGRRRPNNSSANYGLKSDFPVRSLSSVC